jgi:hypothetical protein
MLKFSQPIHARSITVSSLVNVGAMVMPPKSIRIMGGNDPANLRLLYQAAPPADTLLTSNYLIPYECKFQSVPVRFIKVTVEPFGRMPVSLRPVPPPPPAKEDTKVPLPSKKDEKAAPAQKKEKPKPFNDKGWFFVDELFVN